MLRRPWRVLLRVRVLLDGRIGPQAARTLQLEQLALENQRLRDLLAMFDEKSSSAFGSL